MKANDSIQAIPEVQRTYFIFTSTCRRAEHVEERGLVPGFYQYRIKYTNGDCETGKLTKQ
jgi:hypothetical protein